MLRALSLQSKMRIAGGVMLASVVALGLFTLASLDSVNAQARVMDRVWAPRAHAAEQMGIAAREYRLSEAIRILSVAPEVVAHADADLEANAQAFDEEVAAYRALLKPKDSSAAIGNIEKLWKEYLESNQQMLALAREGKIAEASLRFRNTSSRFYVFADALNQLTDFNAERASAASATATRINDSAHVALGAAFSIVALLFAAAIIFLEFNVWRPLRRLSALMERIAHKEYDLPVKWVGQADEIGEMARAVQVFKDNGIEKLALEAEAEETRRRHDETMAVIERQRGGAIEVIGVGLEKLSAGDMTFRISEPLAPEFRKLQDDFNAAMDKLQDAMKVIAANATGIRLATEEISQSASELSHRTENQAASLEEAAAALDQITMTVRKTATSAKSASSTVHDAKLDAERSAEIVGEAVSAMREIEKSSKEIAQNIGVIDEIAFLTSVLALNAGVEAARAGDAGRGFAVVASEVRALAQRSANAAQAIKALIQTSGSQVGAGVQLVNNTGAALERILVKVKELNDITIEIANTAKEEATGLQEVNSSIGQMDQVTQQNTAMVEESTAACITLAREAQQLSDLIGRFELGGTPRTSVAPPVGRPKRAPERMLRRGSAGVVGAALRMAPVDEEWEEF